jgi:hypothetical protein
MLKPLQMTAEPTMRVKPRQELLTHNFFDIKIVNAPMAYLRRRRYPADQVPNLSSDVGQASDKGD